MKKSIFDKSVRVLLFVLLSSILLHFARPVLVPFAIGGLLAILFTPLCIRLEKIGLWRGLSALLCLLIFLAITGAVFALLAWQVSAVTQDFEQLKENITEQISRLRTYVSDQFGISRIRQDQMLEDQTSSGSSGLGTMAKSVVGSLVVFTANLILTLVYMLLLLYYRSQFKNFILKMVPADQQARTKKIINQSGKVVQHYLVGLAIMVMTLWVMYGIGFSIVGIKGALFFAVLCGVLEIIPYIGNITGCSLAAMMALSQGGGTGMVLGVFITYAIVQFIQSNIIAPLILGSEVNINPLFVIIILVVGELLWGLPGMIIAIPLLGISKIIFDNIESLRPLGQLIGSEKQRKQNRILSFIQHLRSRVR